MRWVRLGASLLFVTLVSGSTVFAQSVANRNFTVPLSGDEEVPARATLGRGVAIFQLTPDESALQYRLFASNIENVRQAHIHLGPRGANGPIVAFLYGLVPAGGGRTDGPLAEGTITAANLIGPLLGQPFVDLVTVLRAGGAYVNVHTDDGIPPTNTGPGDFPGGEIRGQVDRGQP